MSLQYNKECSPEENTARALLALASAVDSIGLNKFGRMEDMGCLEKLAVDLPESIRLVAESIRDMKSELSRIADYLEK